MATTFTLESPAFTNRGTIPTRFTCDGEDVSPELRWRAAPDGTKSFALLVEDPDAPSGTFTHWILFDIPAAQSHLPEGGGAGELGTTAGTNDSGKPGYKGPCPPPGHGSHRYIFTLYALDRETLPLTSKVRRDEFVRAIGGHTLDKAELIGRYQRE